MKKIFSALALFAFVSSFSQPLAQDIKKYKIKMASEKRTGVDDSHLTTRWYDVLGNDSVRIDGAETFIAKNTVKGKKLIQQIWYDGEGKAGDQYDYEYKPDGSYKVTYTEPINKMKSYDWYNAKNVLQKFQSPDGNTITCKYDAKGNIISRTSDGENYGIKINDVYTYNAKGQLIKEVDKFEDDNYTYIYEYDKAGHLIRSSGSGVRGGEKSEDVSVYEYNEKGLKKKCTVTSKTESDPGTSAIITYEFEYQYY